MGGDRGAWPTISRRPNHSYAGPNPWDFKRSYTRKNWIQDQTFEHYRLSPPERAGVEILAKMVEACAELATVAPTTFEREVRPIRTQYRQPEPPSLRAADAA